MSAFDVAVVGVGGIGSAVLAECVRRGVTAIGVDRYEPPHAQGSSHGRTRLFRKAYFEDERYIPLLHRAEELWLRLERETSQSIFRRTGLLMAGPRTSALVARSFAAAQQHGLPTERLDARETSERFPAVRMRDDEIAIFEAAAGVLDPEKGTRAHLAIAQRGEFRFGSAMKNWTRHGDEVRLALENGEEICARHLVLTLGPWFAGEMQKLGVAIRVQRNVQAWFAPTNAQFRHPQFPAFLVDRPELPAAFYGFPDFGEGVKAAFHGHGEIVSPDQINRAIDRAADIAPLQSALESWMPGAGAQFREASACMYSLTPDEHFVIDRHPENARVILCGGFSGHGYKFAPVIGEIALELALDGRSRHDIEFLSARRFA
ncbi:MAG: N-methyl-L-tryptophan oxidase [Verrucomicrobiota bacterium]|nr:N-methyl-L-tryptophan oxidase [Verrucomicrobiota bacterium]